MPALPLHELHARPVLRVQAVPPSDLQSSVKTKLAKTKRYVILVIVLVGDLFFISTSLIYTYLFFMFQRGELGWYLGGCFHFLSEP